MVDHHTLCSTLGNLLSEQQATITTAESCTGGGIAESITQVAGSSRWFSYGFITYSNAAKRQLLNISSSLLEQHGAVSQAVVEAMAINAAKLAGADYSIAVSGVAGPTGGSIEKPVGTVWLAWQLPKKHLVSEHCLFLGDRQGIRNQSITRAISRLIEETTKNTV